MFFSRKQKAKLSHDLSMFANYLHRSRNQAGSAMHKSIQEFKHLSDRNDLSHLSDSTNQFHSEMFGRLYEDSDYLDTPSAQWASDIHEVLDDLPEFARLQRVTQNDADLASLSTAYVMDHFKDTIFETALAIKEQAEQNEQQNQEDGGDRPTDMNQMGISDLSQEKQDGIESNAIQASLKMDKVVQDVKQAKQAMNDLGIGCGNSDDQGQRQQLIEKTMHSPTVARILEMLGRLKKSMRSQPAMVKNMPKVKSYEIHQDRAPKELTRERMLACHDDTWDNYCFRFATKKQWKRKKENGTDKVGKGPITICLDISGSMSGKNIEWAKSFVLALYSIAKSEKREVKMCIFNKTIRDTDFTLLKTGTNYSRLLNKICNIGTSGGTRFDPPLNWAMDNVQPKGDIVFVTDGAAHVSENTFTRCQTKLKETGTRLFTVYIEASYNHQLRELSPLEIGLIDVMSKESNDKVGSLLRSIKS